jgi:hypothetical protein
VIFPLEAPNSKAPFVARTALYRVQYEITGMEMSVYGH